MYLPTTFALLGTAYRSGHPAGSSVVALAGVAAAIDLCFAAAMVADPHPVYRAAVEHGFDTAECRASVGGRCRIRDSACAFQSDEAAVAHLDQCHRSLRAPDRIHDDDSVDEDLRLVFGRYYIPGRAVHRGKESVGDRYLRKFGNGSPGLLPTAHRSPFFVISCSERPSATMRAKRDDASVRVDPKERTAHFHCPARGDGRPPIDLILPLR